MVSGVGGGVTKGLIVPLLHKVNEGGSCQRWECLTDQNQHTSLLCDNKKKGGNDPSKNKSAKHSTTCSCMFNPAAAHSCTLTRKKKSKRKKPYSQFWCCSGVEVLRCKRVWKRGWKPKRQFTTAVVSKSKIASNLFRGPWQPSARVLCENALVVPSPKNKKSFHVLVVLVETTKK